MPDFSSLNISPFRFEHTAPDDSAEQFAAECDVSPEGVTLYVEEIIGCRSASMMCQPLPAGRVRELAAMLLDAAREAEIAARELA